MALLELVGTDVNDVERICEFVGYFQAPVLARAQPAVEVLDDLAPQSPWLHATPLARPAIPRLPRPVRAGRDKH